MNLLRNIIEKAVWKYDNSKFHVQTSESGLHSDLYLNTDYVVSDPQLVEEIVKNIFVKELEVQNIKPDWIVSYPPFGLSISHILARECGAKFAYINRETNSCNFEIKKGDKVIVVGDDIYSGGSLKQTIEILKTMGAEVVSPILTIGNFSGTEELSGLSIFSTMSEKGNLYSKDECPMCKEGSKAVLPRPNWNKLKKENKSFTLQ